jgi:hypothetical protein
MKANPLLTRRYIEKLKLIQLAVVAVISVLLAMQWAIFKDTTYQCISFIVFFAYLLYAYSHKSHSLSISLNFEIKGNSAKVNRFKCFIHIDAEHSPLFRQSLIKILDATGTIKVIDIIKIIERIDKNACQGKRIH